MNSKYRKHATHMAAVDAPTLGVSLGGCTKESLSGAGDAMSFEINAIQAMSEITAQPELDGQVLPGLNDTSPSDAGSAPGYPRAGVRYEIIEGLQQRSMDLGSVDNDEPADYLGEIIQQVVKYFQRQDELSMGGIVGNVAWDITMPSEAKYCAVPKGTQGDDAERVQQRLYELEYPATADLVAGNFGDSMETAMLKLQEVNGLEQNGKVGQRTINLLYNDEIKPNFLPYGEKNDVVLACQKRLKELGYLTAIPDGAYGKDTAVAVKQFQVRDDQVVGGYPGPSTRIALSSPDTRANGLTLGKRGDAVTKVQQLLNKYGYPASGSVTGYYGEATENAVRNFQSHNELTFDGLVGVQTMVKPISNSVGRPVASSGDSGVTTKSGNSGNSGNTGNNGGSGDTGKSSGDIIPPVSIPSGGDASALMSAVPSKLGPSYIQGAEGPNSFDCFGLVYWCFNQVDINQNYLTSLGWRSVGRYTKIMNLNGIQTGDIVVVRGHVGIVAGGDTAIDASSSNEWVVHRNLSQWRTNNFTCTWRIL